MMHAARPLIVSFCILLFAGMALAQPKVVLTPDAQAQISAADQQRASVLRTEGTKLFRDGRYKEAIAKFSRAFEINRDISLLYTIAINYQNLEAWQECVSHMERFLESAPMGPKRDRASNTKKSCEARIERDQQLIIESSPSGAKVFLDEHNRGVQGTTPFRNYVKPGQHRVWIELPGYDTVDQQIEVQKATPFRMNVQMRKVSDKGWLYVDATVIDARVYIDGKNVGLTPFQAPLPYASGLHQVVVERDGYTRFTKQVNIAKGRLARVDAHMVQTEHQSSWRSPVGWTMNVFGFLAVAGGGAAYYFAEQQFNDTPLFKDLALYETLGYSVGGGLMALGTGLIIWDKSRDVIAEKDRNPAYGKPVKLDGVSALRFGVSPNGMTFGFSF